MSFDFLKHRQNKNLIPVEIQNKESYYYDLMNIEQSWTGRIDVWLSNTFIQEAVQLTINAINLFEMGYFDCAYYSLRQSLEISTTMIYLADIDEGKRQVELEKWKSKAKFPMQSQMMAFLDNNGSAFKDLKEKLRKYFEYLDSVKKRLNKFVHKQGFDKFYVSRNHPANSGKSRDEFVAEFESHLKTCIGAVAVFRLGVDPFPILLNDEEIFHRTGDLITRSYSDTFISTYIGHGNIESYKETEVYQDHYAHYINEEKKEEFVTNVVKHQYIDTNEIDEILKQQHLLGEINLGAVFLCDSSEKITKVYAMGGLMPYFTDRNSVRTKTTWDSRDFDIFKESNPSFNITFDEAFITYVMLNEQDYFIEHNEPFSRDEIKQLNKINI